MYPEREFIDTEVDYERERMHDAIAAMLFEVSKIQPFMLWINRVQFAGKGTIEIVYELLKAEHTENIGIVLGMNETPNPLEPV